MTGPRSVTVATFNIRHGTSATGQVRTRALAAACVYLDADILGLQEVDRRRRRSWMRDQAGVVARHLGAHRHYGAALRRGVGEYGNALIARGEIDDAEVRRLPGIESRQARVAILGRVTVRDLEVSVAVTHLQHWPPRLRHLPDEAPGQLESVLGWLRERPGPRLLLGDLNLEPHRAEPILTAAGFDVAPTGPTFPTDRPRVRVDYIAVDDLTVVQAAVAPANHVSDHRAVVAELRATRDSLP